MTTFNFNETELELLITHHIGNKHLEDDLLISDELTNMDDETASYVLTYFLQDFKLPEFYGFTHSVELEMNEVYTFIKQIFDNKEKYKVMIKKIVTSKIDILVLPRKG